MQALILAGGKGERLRPLVSDVPKPMASFNNLPFLEYLIYQLKRWQIKDIIISICYKGKSIKDYFKDGKKWSVKITYSEENEPLGTGGAIKYAIPNILSYPLLIMNGDSMFDVDINEMLNFHKNKLALITIGGVLKNDTGRFGKISLAEDCKILSFEEKKSNGKGIINSGIYLMERRVIEDMPNGFFSLERDIFPLYLDKNFYCFVYEGFFIDIGVPEDYLWLKENSHWLLNNPKIVIRQ